MPACLLAGKIAFPLAGRGAAVRWHDSTCAQTRTYTHTHTPRKHARTHTHSVGQAAVDAMRGRRLDWSKVEAECLRLGLLPLASKAKPVPHGLNKACATQGAAEMPRPPRDACRAVA